MKVELLRTPGEVETYKVRMADVASQHVVLGTVKRAGETDWHFTPSGQLGDGVLTLHARDADELRSVLGARFGSLDIPADRLSLTTMEQFADTMLTSLNLLAAKTDSMSGYAAALSRAVATMVAEDVKPEQEDVFKTRFMQNVDSHVQSMRTMNSMRAHVQDFLGSLFRTNYEKDADDDEPIKH